MTAADRVLDLEISTKILFEGIILGTFTGKAISKYISGVRQDWLGARKTVNGNDKKYLIRDYAIEYYKAISYTT